MKSAILAAGLVLAAALPAAAQTAPGRVALGASIGTPGIGAELKFKANDQVVLRGAVDGLSYSHDVNYDNIDYDGKLKMFTGGAFADLHPFAGSGFLVSGGAYFGTRKIDLHATPVVTGTVKIGDVTYTGSQVGQLDGRVKMSKFQPFAGLGYDNSFTSDRRWGFKAMAGVAFSKKPDVTLTASGPLASNAQFQQELARELTNIRDDAKGFRYFPVVQLGLSYRF